MFYFLSFSHDGTQLYLDGELFEEAGENTEVGGWWQGAERKMNNINQLRGFLAGLSVVVGRREHSEVFKSLVQCSESLQLPF